MGSVEKTKNVRIGVGKTVTVSGLTLTGAAASHYSLATTTATTTAAITPVPMLAVSATTVNSGAAITVTVTDGPGNALDWVTLGATSAGDGSYLAWTFLNGAITPPATGMTSATLTFTAPTMPGTYNFRLMAGTTKLATSPTVTVQALPALSLNNVSVTEGQSGTATFTVTLTPTSPQPVTVAYTTANGTAAAGSDYVATSGTLTFAAGVSTQTIAVTVTGDTTFEPGETFVVNLSSATNATISGAQGVGTIVNDDTGPTPTLTVSAATVNPGATITVTVANGPGNPSDWVMLAATSAADSGYLTWQYLNGWTTPPATGLTSATLQFTAPMTSGTYNFRLLAGGTKLATSPTVTVQALPTLSLNSVSVTEGQSGTATAMFTATLTPTSPQPVTVAYTTANGTATAGSDYVATSGTLTLAAGVSAQTIAVTVTGDTTFEPGETFVINLSGATNATISGAQGVGTIVNDDTGSTPTLTVSATTVNPGATITVTVANGPGNASDWVMLAATSAADSGYLTWQYLNGLTTPPATGLTSATLTLTAPMTSGTYNFRLMAGGTKLATSPTVTVQAPPPPTLTVSATTVSPGAPVTVTVANGPGNPSNWVMLAAASAADSSYLTWQHLNGSTIPPATGLTSATLTFTAPTTPGTYNFRFMAGTTKLATSATVTVQ